MYSNYRTPRSKERVVIGGFVEYFREQIEGKIPCEGDGDLSALWMIATRSPGVCLELMRRGLGDLFPEGATLPDLETYQKSREWGHARFS